MQTSKFIFLLDCQHIVSVMEVTPPIVFEVRYCARCRGERLIVMVDAEYRMSCKTCSVGRAFGTAKLLAQLFADKHHRKFPLHIVQILQGNVVLEVRNQQRFQQDMFDIPPF